MKLILASASPRRAELLRQVAIPYEAVEPLVEESVSEKLEPQDMVMSLALRKAHAVSGRLKEGVILAADTVVLHRGEILGKPAGIADACRMLRRLSGDNHDVLTALVLLDAASGRIESGISKTRVWMKQLTDEQIDAYTAGGEPLDKAGAYGIQGKGALLIEKIDGCYFNVVGLPLGLLYDLMRRMGLPTWLNRKDGDYEK